MKTEIEILSAVQESIGVVLDIEKNEIKETSKLVGDLGAESIDFLDISCELEKAIDYELDFKDIFNAQSSDTATPNDIEIKEIVSFLVKKEV